MMQGREGWMVARSGIGGRGCRGWARLLVVCMLTLVTATFWAQNSTSQQVGTPAPAGSAVPIDAYIRDAWGTLQRSMLECATIVDPKVRNKPVLYLPQDFA